MNHFASVTLRTPRSRRALPAHLCVTLVTAAWLWSGSAAAQDEPMPEASPAAPVAEPAAPVAEPAPEPAPVEVAEPAPVAPAEPDTPSTEVAYAEPEAEAEEPAEDAIELPPISVNAWLHSTFRLQSFEDPEKLNDISHEAEIDLLVGGEITDNLGITANFVGMYGPTLDAMGNVSGDINGSVAILDLIARIKAHDTFNIWAGRMLVP